MTDRALSPVVATLLLVGLVLSTAVVVGAASDALVAGASARAAAVDSDSAGLRGVGAPGASADPAAGLGPSPRPTAFSLSATGDELAVTYERGPTLDASALRLRIAVDGDPLAFQPPLPFFAARGFRSGPTGPFNVAADGAWSAGETATLAVAETNDPELEPGRTVTVRLYRGSSSRPLATLTASVSAAPG
ncbi:archaellin/type IV pilin N-terminal domain-containing protein [Halogeometricum luteum]|uniref:Type IV pilin n=1 Tax=Halogeometricum luteum TaxID=2950537 RepID=A0ABU2G6S1_9EURY|nr:archaellin/type IV pilin N-terminal domain-containing protein [Halogeometricum sp. S3BR5-2]MDS0296490.1 type IV pilin [Halogeometricum sp. S3BR5-2]